jgi:hypothetical protein
LKKQQPTLPTEAPLERSFRLYAETYKAPQQRALLLISAVLLMLGLLGLSWGIPFPHLKFLGQYNGFINWASFFIALAGYYYYRLSPVICYVVILLLFILAFIITKLADWQHAGGPSLVLVSGAITATALLMALQINKRVLKKIKIMEAFNYLALTPAWYFAQLLQRKK